KWVPFFLVLGARDEQAARHLMDAASMNFIIANIPDGPAAIHWYASEEAVFIVPNGVGCLSKLAQVEQQALARRSARAEPMPQNPTTGGGTIVAGSGQSNWNSPSEESSLARAITTTVQPGAPCYGKTIAPDALPATPTIRLPESDKHEQRTRLHYFCELISKHRAPIVPVNGVLTIIPFSSIHQSASTVQTASEDDLSTIRAQFQVRCPAILLVTEMQQEYGFLELTKRIGPMQAKESRFGQKYDHQNPPESEQLHALGWHACGFIKDWIYELFRAPDALKRFQGNTRLFALLCKIRGNFMAGLSQILANSFGYDADRGKDLEEEQFYFAGCYFASTGAKDDEKSFVKSVIRRMLELQSDLSWTPKALAEDERYHAYSNITVFFAMICLVILIVLLGDYFKWWS
ncbi:MAG: hypothetical protein JW829_07015, partial [Pirellulales bacterium]|nr:hypothetical protein [Pirellulales bacterium]